MRKGTCADQLSFTQTLFINDSKRVVSAVLSCFLSSGLSTHLRAATPTFFLIRRVYLLDGGRW